MGSFLELFRIHVWRVPSEACIPLNYGDPIHRLNQQIKKSTPGTKRFAVNRPQPNLRKRWYRALVKTLNDLGNVKPAADSLSMDASLLLNCSAVAENGNAARVSAAASPEQVAHTAKISCVLNICECTSCAMHMYLQWSQ